MFITRLTPSYFHKTPTVDNLLQITLKVIIKRTRDTIDTRIYLRAFQWWSLWKGDKPRPVIYGVLSWYFYGFRNIYLRLRNDVVFQLMLYILSIYIDISIYVILMRYRLFELTSQIINLFNFIELIQSAVCFDKLEIP
jgi:hypothetical protein